MRGELNKPHFQNNTLYNMIVNETNPLAIKLVNKEEKHKLKIRDQAVSLQIQFLEESSYQQFSSKPDKDPQKNKG